MSPKNLINITQLRQDQLSGFALAVTTGYVVTYVDTVSGVLQDQIDTLVEATGATLLAFRVPIGLGIDTIHCAYATSTTSRVSVGSIGSSGASDPIIISMLTSVTATGSVVELSAPTTSVNYYLNLLVPA